MFEGIITAIAEEDNNNLKITGLPIKELKLSLYLKSISVVRLILWWNEASEGNRATKILARVSC
jgi:hypothetical protein